MIFRYVDNVKKINNIRFEILNVIFVLDLILDKKKNNRLMLKWFFFLVIESVKSGGWFFIKNKYRVVWGIEYL